MGMICPVCKTQQPQAKVMDAFGQPPTKSEDVFLITLGCGHTVGAERAAAYVAAATAVKTKFLADRSALERKMQSDLQAAWETLAKEA